MEEIKMKTKTNKSEQFINSMPIINFIILAVIMTLYSSFSESSMSNSIKIQKSSAGYINGILPSGNQLVIPVNSEENDNASEKQNMSFIISIKGFCFTNDVNQNLETDKLIVRNKNVLYSKRNSQNSELTLLADKLSKYLVAEIEPELELEVLPINEEQLTKNIYVKNEYLENLRETKIAELENFYAMQLICREYLVEEIEPPLELEKWMCDENCWGFKNNTTFAMNEK